MKITNEQIRQIIKEELEAVMNESILQNLGIAKAGRAAADRRRADLERQRGLSPDNPYRPGYGPNAGGMSSAERERAQAKADREAADFASQSKANAEREQLRRDESASLESLGQAKLKAIQTLGLDEDGSLPYMYAWGNGENWLGTYYDGPLDYYEALSLAGDTGNIAENAIDDESGGFHLGRLFPGEYEQE